MKVFSLGVVFSHLILFYFQPIQVKIAMFCFILIAFLVAFQWRDKGEKVKGKCKLFKGVRVEEQYEIKKSCVLYNILQNSEETESIQEKKGREGFSHRPNPIPVKELPTDVWKRILNKLTEAQDLVACSNTCKRFRELLEIQIRAKALGQAIDYVKTNSYERVIRQDILNCRLVSKSWQQSIDQFLQQHPCHVTDEKEDFPDTVIDSLDIRNVEGLLHRLMEQGRCPTNPFPSRHLQITIHSDLMLEGDHKIFHAAVYLILKYFGKHLWYMTVTINTESHAVHLYEQIYEYLGKTPNLKIIRFKVNSVNNNNGTGLDADKFYDFVRNHDFPQLGHLVEAKFNGLPDSITESFLKSNQRRKLTVRG